MSWDDCSFLHEVGMGSSYQALSSPGPSPLIPAPLYARPNALLCCSCQSVGRTAPGPGSPFLHHVPTQGFSHSALAKPQMERSNQATKLGLTRVGFPKGGTSQCSLQSGRLCCH